MVLARIPGSIHAILFNVIDTLAEFGEWAESENLQILATRVSTGDECSIIIEDGRVVENED